MTTKYGLSNVRDQFIKDLEGAYPTKWEDYKSAKVLGEDIFGSPKPHPNVVLYLFEGQKVEFAIPFATYRASIGGFKALMSDKPARMVASRGDLWMCTHKACLLGVDMSPIKARMEAVGRIYNVMIDQSKGGLFSAPCLDDLLCQKCAKCVEAIHEAYGSAYWERLGLVFNVSGG